jgi:hypothetical protein
VLLTSWQTLIHWEMIVLQGFSYKSSLHLLRNLTYFCSILWRRFASFSSLPTRYTSVKRIGKKQKSVSFCCGQDFSAEQYPLMSRQTGTEAGTGSRSHGWVKAEIFSLWNRDQLWAVNLPINLLKLSGLYVPPHLKLTSLNFVPLLYLCASYNY